MKESSEFLATNRVAVVTGANKGLGLEICRQLASKGVTVVLTARNEKRGLEALAILKGSPNFLSNNVVFHQLDVVDRASIARFADFIGTQFGKLDILVNNAAVVGVQVCVDAAKVSASIGAEGYINWKEISTQTCDLAEECLKTNYYGAKDVTEALIPFLQSSDSPRIINVSSSSGKLKYVFNEWAINLLVNGDFLTQETVDDILNEFLKDFKEGLLETKHWPKFLSAYTLSKAALNAYTRILAKKYSHIMINSVCPGYVKTDINFHLGFLTVEEGAESPVWLALLPKSGPSGQFFSGREISSF